jgi:hypothetical protein
MSKAEYHLLYVLSEPPVPVAKRKIHGWSAGDVLSAPQNSDIPPTLRFVVLDCHTDGRMVALRMTHLPDQAAQTSDDYLCASHTDESDDSGTSPTERTTSSNDSCDNIDVDSRYICFDKVYYEAAIVGTEAGVDSVLVVDSLSPELMNLVISKFIKKFGRVLKQPWVNCVADRLSGDTTMSIGDATPATGAESSHVDAIFQQLMTYAFQLPRFLNLAHLAFDDTDYAAIRDFLKLPSKRIIAQFNVLNCGCGDHFRKARRSSDPTASIWRTYDKLSHCAQKLNINLAPSDILSQLNDLSSAFGCQRKSSDIFKGLTIL